MSRAYRPVPPPARSRSDRLPELACWLLILAFAVFFGALALQQHRTFQTNALDLGNVDQALWNTARGRFFQFTLMAPVQSRLALHVEPILLAWLPLYWLGLGGPAALLLGQAAVVALGAWPLYRLALGRYRLALAEPGWGRGRPDGEPGSGEGAVPLAAWLALVFPLAYLLLPTLEAAVLYDFHAVTLAPTFLLFSLWALERGRDRYFVLFAALAMACKEDMPLVVVMLAVFYVGLARRRWRLAGLTASLGLAWFVIAVGLIQPGFAAGGNIQLDRYAWLGADPAAMVYTALTRPGLVVEHLVGRVGLAAYLWALFFPTAFLALFSPLTLLPMLPSLAVNLLSDNPFTWRLEEFHYGAPLAPLLMVSALFGLLWLAAGLNRLGQRLGRNRLPAQAAGALLVLTLLLLACSGVYHYYRGFSPLARPYSWPRLTGHHRLLAEILAGVPGEAALFAQSNLAPHLAQRPAIYADFGLFTDPAFPAAAPVDEVALDVTSLENIGGLHQYLQHTLLESGQYRLAAARDGILRLARQQTAASPVVLPPGFYTFAEAGEPPDYALPVVFEDVMRLHGLSLHFNRQEEVQVSVDLELLRPPEPGLQPVLYLLDDGGEPLGATVDLQPGLAWFPPDRWPVGETVRLRFNTLPWPGFTRQAGPHRLALGLIAGDDPWTGRRYRPEPAGTSPWAVRLPAGGSLVELARIEPVWGMPAGGPQRRRFETPAPAQRLGVNFENQLLLVGYNLPGRAEEPGSWGVGKWASRLTGRAARANGEEGDAVSIELVWQALAAPEPLVRFVQVVGPDGSVYGQNDAAPDGGSYPTRLWLPGEVVVERVTVPLAADRPAGSYRLHLGLYRPASLERLQVVGGGDHIEIALAE